MCRKFLFAVLPLTCDTSLAYAELYLILSTLVRRFDLELYETTKKNIDFARDFGTPYPEEGNFSVRVMVTGIVD